MPKGPSHRRPSDGAQPINAVGPGSPDDLVTVATFLDVPSADLAQLELKRQGIASALENANFVLWQWQYSNAVGGVKVLVQRHAAVAARNALDAAVEQPADVLPPWDCSACGSRIAGQWDACWRCGCPKDGAPASRSVEVGPQVQSEADVIPQLDGRQLLAAALLLLLAAILPRFGLAPFLLCLPFVVLFRLIRWPTPPEPAVADNALEGFSARHGNAIVQRAWRSAVFAFFFFPPLGLYSVWLLWKLRLRRLPLGIIDKWRIAVAIVLIVTPVLICLLIGVVALLAIAWSISWFWIGASIVSLAIAATAAGSVAIYVAAAHLTLDRQSPLMIGAAMAVLRMLLAPPLAWAFGLAAAIAPHRPSQWALLAAAGVEGAVAAYAFCHWFAGCCFI